MFGQGTFPLHRSASLTGGVRYTDDQKNATIYRANFFGGVVINNAYVPLNKTNFDYTLSADYRWTDEIMTYLKYATGFKGAASARVRHVPADDAVRA